MAEVSVEAQKGNENVTRLSEIPTSVPGRKQERGEVAAVPVWHFALRLLPRSLVALCMPAMDIVSPYQVH